MSENVKIDIIIDDTQEKMALEELERKNNDVTRAAVRARREVERTVRKAGAILRGLMHATRAWMNVFGITIDAVGMALVNIIEGAIATAIAYALLQTAIVTGGGWRATAGLAAALASLEISIMTAGAVAVKNEEAAKRLQALDSALTATAGMFDTLGRG